MANWRRLLPSAEDLPNLFASARLRSMMPCAFLTPSAFLMPSVALVTPSFFRLSSLLCVRTANCWNCRFSASPFT